MSAHPGATTMSVNSPAEATALVSNAVAIMRRLTDVLNAEAKALKTSDLDGAMALGTEKTDASLAYVRIIPILKSESVAISRWAPGHANDLKARQAELLDAMTINLAVLATARSVSEGLLRRLAGEIAAPQTLSTYGATGRSQSTARASATPLAISKSF